MNIATLLQRTARRSPQQPAVFVGTRQISNYGELAERAASIAGGLQRLGCQPGDRVAVYMTNAAEYLEILYGIWWGGLAAVPVNAKLHPRELAYIAGDSGARVLFVSPDLQDSLDDATFGGQRIVAGSTHYLELCGNAAVSLVPRAPDDLAWLFYTSGTTGQPKGVMDTHRNILTMTACYFMDVDEVSARDAIVYAAPMSHGAGMYNFPHVLRGARHVVPASGGFDPEELVALAGTMGPLSLFAAPTMVRRLVDYVARQGAPCPGFKTIVYGGGPMYVADIQRGLEVMGNCFVQIYGQGESPMTITALPRHVIADRSHPRWAERLGSVGVAQSLVEVQVVADDGRPLGPGEVGEIVVRGDTVMAGYWGNPQATAKTLRNGWLWTGDIGTLDADGFLTLKDRSKDLIISGGSNIYPREVEEVLLRHPGVTEVSVVGKPDAEWGEVVVAFVVGSGVTGDDLDALCLDHIARFKRPKEYRFVDALPKSHYGKVLKTALREQLRTAG